MSTAMNLPDGAPKRVEQAISSTDLAGSLPSFPPLPGEELAASQHVPNIRRKRLLFNRLTMPGQVHVYSATLRAGQRLRVQMYVPVLAGGGAAAPAFAIIAQSLPYSTSKAKGKERVTSKVEAKPEAKADGKAEAKLMGNLAPPLDIPAGYSTMVAPPPGNLEAPVQDLLTRVRFYPGPTLDTRPLVGGRCYLVVWSPQNRSGKYVLQVGHRWSWRVGYWLQLPRYWWQIRGWFGMGRQGLIWASSGAAMVGVNGDESNAKEERMMNDEWAVTNSDQSMPDSLACIHYFLFISR